MNTSDNKLTDAFRHITGNYPLREISPAEAISRDEPAWLVDWQQGFERYSIAVWGNGLSHDDAAEAAEEFMDQLGKPAEYVRQCTPGEIQELVNDTVKVTVMRDEFGTFFYRFTHNGIEHECFDFPSDEEAHKGAAFHLHCLWNNLPHEVADGVGAIYRP